MPRALSLTIPGTPPTGNTYVRHTRTGKHYRTPEANKFFADLAAISAGRSVKAHSYKLALRVYLAAGQRLDLDNASKVAIDGLVAARVIHSDAAVCELFMQKFRDPSAPRTEIEVEGF